MGKTKEELLEKLAEAVFEMEEEEAVEISREYLAEGYLAFDGIMLGLVEGMNRASILFDEEEYFVTDILLCSDAMYAGLEVLKPYLQEESKGEKRVGIIGVVEGDTHDIGKKIMLETAGFDMIDLGRDVAPEQFVAAAKEFAAEFVCMSTLMTTTMSVMETVIHLLEEAGIRDQVKVMVGGGPVSQKFAEKIGADGYSQNAVEAVRLAKKLLQIA